MIILGVSSFYHDSAAAIIKNENLIAAAQEERFTRIKHDAGFPINAINYCLEAANCSLNEIDYVAFYDKPFLKFERLLETYLSFAPRGFISFKAAMPIWLREKLFQKDLLRKEFQKFDKNFDWKNKLLFSEHHQSHAASAFYPSPFQEALILTMDGVGEWATTTVAHGSGNSLNIERELHFPHSLGLLYSAFTYFTGFKVNSGEYKVMGLAPYGEPKYKNLILDELIDLKEDGTFRLNQKYFDYCTGLRMTNNNFDKLFGFTPRDPEELLNQDHMDLASSIQSVTEEVVLRIAKSLAKETKQNNLCLAGGVALNCVANGKILKNKIFENIWIQPAAGDAGGSLGAALAFWHKELDKERSVNKNDQMKGAYLGPSFNDDQIEKELKAVKAEYKKLSNEDLINTVAQELAKEKTIGWFQGRMEFGPRALGGRSIIADPRSEKMQKELNLKVKFRESFRPFAPSVLKEDVSDWFDLNSNSPYMLLVADVKKDKQISMTDEQKNLFGIDKLNIKRSSIPAVTHVDYSARIQTVHQETNPKYHKLISKFKEITGCSVVVNTSFNVRGEPIVCSIKDAFNCFMGTNLDILVCENFILYKDHQDKSLKKDYKKEFELD